MHNSFSFGAFYPVNSILQANTFSGQPAARLWETMVQVGGLYAGLCVVRNSLWENLAAFTQRSGLVYTAFPTASPAKIAPVTAMVFPHVHRLYKEDNEVYKENLGVS